MVPLVLFVAVSAALGHSPAHPATEPAALAIDLTPHAFRLTDKHGRAVLDPASVGHGRFRRGSPATAHADEQLTLQFSIDKTDYTFDLGRTPSVVGAGSAVTVVDSFPKTTSTTDHDAAPFEVVRTVSNAAVHAPIIFKSADGSAVLTFLNPTTVVGVVLDHTHNRTLSLASERQGRSLGVAASTLGGTGSCGVGVNLNRAARGLHGGLPRTAEGESTAARHARAVAKWDNCFPNDSVKQAISVGAAIDSRMYAARLNSDEGGAVVWLASVFASANVIYETQLNVVLKLGDVFIQKSTNGAPSWNNPECASDLKIGTVLANFRAWSPPKAEGLWHLFGDCWNGGTIGLANVGVLCESGWNRGVTWYGGSTWATFAHEVGHNFGASHSFEEGQGSTGGIMDYSDGTLDGEFQFNTKYRKAEVCEELTEQINLECPHIVPHTVVCGNGVVEEGEECECAIGQQACTHCDNCQLAPDTVCSPDAFIGSECCSDTGLFKTFGTDCALVSGGLGYCGFGTCLVSSPCSFSAFGDFCGLWGESGDDSCKAMCMYNGKCDDLSRYTLSNKPAENVKDGTLCHTASGECGGCVAGSCTVDDAPTSCPVPLSNDSGSGDEALETTTAPAPASTATAAGTTVAETEQDGQIVCSLVGADQVIWDENADFGVIVAVSMDQPSCEAECLATSGCFLYTVSAFWGYCELWSAASGHTVDDLQDWMGYDTYLCAVATSTTTATATTTTTTVRPTTLSRPELDLPQCTYYKDRAFLGQPDIAATSEMRKQAGAAGGFDVISLELEADLKNLGGNIPVSGAVTHEQCKIMCFLAEACRSFGYLSTSGECKLYSKAHAIGTLGITTGIDTYFCPERAGSVHAVEDCELWAGFNIQGSEGTDGWLGGNVDADIDSVGNNNRPYTLAECDAFCREEEACHYMVYHQATSFCELWSAQKAMSDVKDAAGSNIDVYVCKTQLSCPTIAYEYTMPDSWDESAGCGEARTRAEVETCTASGTGANGVACTCSKRRAVQTESEFWKCCAVDHTYTWGPWLPATQDAPDVGLVANDADDCVQTFAGKAFGVVEDTHNEIGGADDHDHSHDSIDYVVLEQADGTRLLIDHDPFDFFNDGTLMRSGEPVVVSLVETGSACDDRSRVRRASERNGRSNGRLRRHFDRRSRHRSSTANGGGSDGPNLRSRRLARRQQIFSAVAAARPASSEGGRAVGKALGDGLVDDGPRDALVIRMAYVGGDIDYCDEACAAAVMHDDAAGGSVDALYRDTSYGRVSFPATHTTVVTVQIAKPVLELSGCPFDAMGADADAAAAALGDPAYDPALYTHRVYIMPNNDIGCGNVAGVSYTGACDYGKGSSSCKAWVRTMGPDSSPASVLAHELGHNLGVKHASTAAAGVFAAGVAAGATSSAEDNNVGSTYGDHSGVMGNGAALVGFTAPNRHALGWLDGANDVLDHPADCTLEPTQTVASLDLEPSSGNGYSAITVGRMLGGKYWISFRSGAAGGRDSKLSAAYANKLSIHYHLGGPTSTVLLATLAPGSNGGTFEGTSAVTKAAFTVTFVGVSDGGAARVVVDFGCGGSTEPPAVPQPLPATWNGGVCADKTVTGWEYQEQSLGCPDLQRMGYCSADAMGGAVVDDCPVTCGVCDPSGGGFAGNPFPEAAAVGDSSEQTCGLEMVRSEIQTCDATGRDAAGPCGCTSGSERATEQETMVNEPCVEDERRTCAELGWEQNENGVCYATNVIDLKPWRASLQCKVLKRQYVNYTTAVGHCEAVGARLCTQAEVSVQPHAPHSASCTRDVRKRVWTSTPCGKVGSGKKILLKATRPGRTWCSAPTNKFKNSYRCCADVVLPAIDFYVPDPSDGHFGDVADDDDAGWVGSGLLSGSGYSSSGLLRGAVDNTNTQDEEKDSAGGSLGPGAVIAIVVIAICAVGGTRMAIFLVRKHRFQRKSEHIGGGAKSSDEPHELKVMPPVLHLQVHEDTSSDEAPTDELSGAERERRMSHPIRRISNFAEASTLNGESADDGEVLDGQPLGPRSLVRRNSAT